MKLTPLRRYAAGKRIHPATVYRLLASGTPKAKKIGRRTFVIDDARSLPDYRAASRRGA